MNFFSWKCRRVVHHYIKKKKCRRVVHHFSLWLSRQSDIPPRPSSLLSHQMWGAPSPPLHSSPAFTSPCLAPLSTPRGSHGCSSPPRLNSPKSPGGGFGIRQGQGLGRGLGSGIMTEMGWGGDAEPSQSHPAPLLPWLVHGPPHPPGQVLAWRIPAPIVIPDSFYQVANSFDASY